MSYSMVNASNGKELKLSDKAAIQFFGAFEGTKKVMCLPCSSEVDMRGEMTPNVYEVKKFKRKKKLAGTLVIRMGGVGDLVMLSSGLREMLARGKAVTVATLPQNVAFMSLLGFKAISIEDMERYQPEEIIDLRFSVEPKEIGGKGSWEDYINKDRSDCFEELLGVYPARKRFELSAEEGDLQYEYVAINASIMASARAIPAKAIKEICRKINYEGRNVVLFGKSMPWNQELLKIAGEGVINYTDQTPDVRAMIQIIAQAKVVIAPDSGTLHIAGALGKPTLALFGNINPRTRISYYPTVRALYPVGELPCIPCWDTHPCMTKPQDGVACMKLVSQPDRVVNAVRELGGL